MIVHGLALKCAGAELAAFQPNPVSESIISLNLRSQGCKSSQ